VAPFDAAQAKQHQENRAKHLGVSVEQTNSLGMPLLLIPPGEFKMGSTSEEIALALVEYRKINISPWFVGRLQTAASRHRVKISRPFYLGIYHVTRGEYEKLMGAQGHPGSRRRFLSKGVRRRLPCLSDKAIRRRGGE
jgi:formylglycine-generating enzyme required for sulfatase activity